MVVCLAALAWSRRAGLKRTTDSWSAAQNTFNKTYMVYLCDLRKNRRHTKGLRNEERVLDKLLFIAEGWRTRKLYSLYPTRNQQWLSLEKLEDPYFHDWHHHYWKKSMGYRLDRQDRTHFGNVADNQRQLSIWLDAHTGGVHQVIKHTASWREAQVVSIHKPGGWCYNLAKVIYPKA